MEKDPLFQKINQVFENKDEYLKITDKYSTKNTLDSFYSLRDSLSDMSSKEQIYKSFLKFFGPSYISLIFIRIFVAFAEFTGPLILGRILGITSNNLNEDDKFYCYIYILIFILFTFCHIMARTYYEFSLKMFRNQLETIIPDLIFKKSLKLSSRVDSVKTEAEISKILNEEISSIFKFFININYAWELPFSILFALYSTYKQVSYSFIPGFIFALLLLIINYKIALKITDCNDKLHQPRLKRKENELMAINNIKSVKFLSMEKYFLNNIYFFRQEEMKLLTIKKYLDALCCYLWAASPVLISFFSIVSYTLTGNLIDAEKIFTTISLLNMTIHPLNVFPWVFSQLKGSKKSFDVLVEFLNKEEKIEPETDTNNTDILFLSNKSDNSDKRETFSISDVRLKYDFNSTNNKEFELFISKENPLHFSKGEITALYGPSGSGKSLILKSLINEAFVFNYLNEKRIINLSEVSIAYVSQDLWTFNSSIYENITMHNGQHATNYNTIVQDCCLVEDLRKMEKKDHTVITSKGSNISGGQKQRINLARAVCHNPDILILDNPLSCIDSNVASDIIKNVLLPLKMKGKIIIIATCDHKFLNLCDHVYLVEGGTIKKQTKTNILSNNYINLNEKTQENIPELLTNTEKENNHNENQNGSGSKSIKLETYKFYFNQTGIFSFLIVVLFVALMQFGKNYIELWLADWVNEEFNEDQIDERKLKQNQKTKMYILFIIFHSLFTTGRSAYFAIYCLKACKKIYETLINKLIYAKMKFFMKPENDIGNISNILQADILVVDEWLPFEFNRLLAYSFGLLGSILVISYSSILSFVIFIPLGFYYLNLFKKYNPASRNLSKKVRNVNEPFLNMLHDTLEGRTIIRTAKKQNYFSTKFSDLVSKKIDLLHTEQYLGFWLSLRLDLIAFYIYTLIIIAIGFCIYSNKIDYITFLSLALTYALNLTNPLSGFLPWVTYTEEQFYSVEKINDKINQIEEEDYSNDENKNKIENSDNTVLKKEITRNEKNIILEFKNVYLSYENNSENQIVAPVLKNVSFQIFRGQKVGIVGRTGAGKTSIFSSLFRLYDITSGEILLDERNIKLMPLSNLRKKIVIIPKDSILIEGSLKQNIDPENIHSEDYFFEFLDKFKELFTLKSEYDLFTKNLTTFKVEMNGKNLSEGQKSIIQILRGLIKNPDIICMDESNADIDDFTEEQLFNIIFKNYPTSTFLVIVHKLNIIKHFEKIITVDNGQVYLK